MLQVIEQTHEEKMEMYLTFSKEELAKMLIECNRLLSSQIKVTIPDINNEYASFENGSVVFKPYQEPQTCKCKREFESSAKFMCDGNCKW